MTEPSSFHPAGRLLAARMALQEWDAARLARSLGEPPAQVHEILAGERPLLLEWLERALAVLGVDPLEFFSELYATPGLRREGTDEVPAREEVDAVLSEVRSLLRGASRMTEAYRKLDEDEGGSRSG